MQFISPEILGETRGLSVSLILVGLIIGFVLWLTGWMGHRFWIVLIATVAAGVRGLLGTTADRVPPLVAGLLLALAAGLLALALVRVVAFAAGGIATYLAVHSLAPASWNDPLLCVLAGGLVGLLLFRVWTMAFTSFGGAVLMGYFGLSLADNLGKLNAVQIAEQRAALLNWACVGVGLIGLVVQFLIDRQRIRLERERMEEDYRRLGKYAYYNQRWWWRRWNARGYYRRAG